MFNVAARDLVQRKLDAECSGFVLGYGNVGPYVNVERYILSFDCGYYEVPVAYSTNPWALLEYAKKLVFGPDGELWTLH